LPLKGDGIMKTYIIDYVVGNTYKVKKIKAETVEQAIKRARVKTIVDINIKEDIVKDKCQLRDF
jgi:hypothetical protein